jgi:3',5'-cyclic AMP phosphodiesterase CpdA
MKHSGAATLALLCSMALIALIFSVSIFAVGWPLQVRVVSPRLGMPSIDRPGASLEVRLESSLPFMVPTMETWLEGPGGAARLNETVRRYEGIDTVLTMTLPPLPDGAYSLHLKTDTQNLSLPKAVFLRHEWPSVLHVVQIADLPPPGREELMQKFVAEMGIRKPDAVLVTGDINYTGSQSNIEFIFSQLALLDAPVVMTAGNHEREAWHRYLRVFGARDHRTNFGPLAILSVDSAHGRDALTPSAFRWLQTELAQLDGRTAIIQLHHPLFPPGSTANSEAGGTGGYLHGYRRALLDICRQHNVAMVLSGHWHQDAVFDEQGNFRADRVDFSGTKYVVTTALGADVRKVFEESEMNNGYRWIEFSNGQLVSYSTDANNPVRSTPLGTFLRTSPGAP